MEKLEQQFTSARKCGVPLLGIETPDQGATIAKILPLLNGDKNHPALSWDIIRSVRSLNESGKEALARIAPNEEAVMALMNPTEMLSQLPKLPDKTVLFMFNAHRFYENEAVAQGIWNLRDIFKASSRMLVLLAPALQLPAELERDVVILDEPLPNDEQLAEIIVKLHEYSSVKKPADMEPIVRASRGLAHFPAEQAVAMSMSRSGVDTGKLWALKRKMIEQTKGLQVYMGGEGFADIGGIEQIKQFGRQLFGGSQPPAAIIFVDEIEKALAGSAGSIGDSSGTSQDQLGVLLSSMQDNEWSGMIAVGPPGCAKSLYAKALGNTHGVPTLKLDLGSLKGSLVGKSEQQVRAAVKIIQAVAGKSAYWVATCNRLDTLPPELRRRFTDGIWFFDLPDREERLRIWKIQRKHYKIDASHEEPIDDQWTGADIRNVCSIAARLQISLVEASAYITPVAKSDPQSIEKLRALADGRFLYSSGKGVYTRGSSNAPTGRQVSL